MNSVIKFSSALILILAISACGSSGGGSKGKKEFSSELPVEVQAALSSEKSILSQELINTISYMGNEERLAYDVYNELYRQYGTKQFTNIANKSEYKHISSVQQLVQKYLLSDDGNFTNIDMPSLGYINTPIESMVAGTYDISVIQALYDNLISKGSASEVDALKVGCMVEVTDINDLDVHIVLATEENASDVITIFNFLRDGSYNHYWSFDKGLINKGISTGCCSIGTVDGVNYCHSEYPKK